MTYAYLTVKVNLEAGSFVRTPEEAKNMVERILQMHPQRRAYGMEVEIQERHPSFQEQEWDPVIDDVIDDDYISAAYDGVVWDRDEPTADELEEKRNRRRTRNVFEQNNQT